MLLKMVKNWNYLNNSHYVDVEKLIIHQCVMGLTPHVILKDKNYEKSRKR